MKCWFIFQYDIRTDTHRVALVEDGALDLARLPGNYVCPEPVYIGDQSPEAFLKTIRIIRKKPVEGDTP